MAEYFLLSFGIGFGISFGFNILYNLIQKKDSRKKIEFGTVMGWGVFISLVFLMFFLLKGCEKYGSLNLFNSFQTGIWKAW